MARRKIALVADANECTDMHGNPVPFWTFNPEDYEKVITKNADIATMRDLIDLCDHDAENCNHHAFVGVHSKLAKLLNKQVGPVDALRVMRDIAHHGGLHGLADNR